MPTRTINVMQTYKNGLYYMRARYYNVDIKHFINRDVVREVLTA